MVFFNRLMDAATQSLVCNQTVNQFEVEDLVLGLKEFENSPTLMTRTTGSKNSQKNPTIRLIIRTVFCATQRSLPYRLLVLDEVKVQDTHSATISVDNNQLKCCCDQQAQLRQLRLVNLTENDAKAHFQAPCLVAIECGLAMDLLSYNNQCE